MEALIKAHQEVIQKQVQAKAEFIDLQTRESELRGKIGVLANRVNTAEQQISKALTSESLEKARADVAETRRNEDNAKMLLKNIELAINNIKAKLPALHNDISLIEQDIWMAQQEQLTQEIKEYPDVLQLMMKAYVAAWQTGYRWELEQFIREKIMDADFRIDPDVLAQFKDEMTKQIWSESETQVSN